MNSIRVLCSSLVRFSYRTRNLQLSSRARHHVPAPTKGNATVLWPSLTPKSSTDRISLAVSYNGMYRPVTACKRNFCSSKKDNEAEEIEVTLDDSVFKGDKQTLDVDREIERYDYEEFEEGYRQEDEEEVEEVIERILPISLDRGKSGVFDIEDLVALLNEENALDLCVVKCPDEIQYVDYMVIATGKSLRHLIAMAEFTKWIFKQRRRKGDPLSVKIEGKKNDDWIAMDLGNIALHLFLEEKRQLYDIETLWTVGPAFDEKTQEHDIAKDYAMENFFFDANQFHPKSADPK